MVKIYFIKEIDTNNFKIGITRKSLENRIAQIQTGNPRKLIAYCVIGIFKSKIMPFSLEKKIHSELKWFKTDGGNEWFNIPQDIMDKVIPSLLDYFSRNSIEFICNKDVFDERKM